MNRFWVLVVFLFILSSGQAEAKKYYVLTTHPHIKSLTKQDLKEIFLGYKKQWPDGAPLRAGHVPIGSQAMQSFIKETLLMTSDDYTTYWRRKLFSGRGYPPRKLNSEMELLSFIQGTPNAIAIGSKKVDLKGIRVIDLTSLFVLNHTP